MSNVPATYVNILHYATYNFLLQDYSLNMEEAKDLTRQFHPEMIFIESGGDNLAANFSRELADYIIYVIDVAGRFLSTSWSTIALCD